MLVVKDLNFSYNEIKPVDSFSYKFEKWKIYGIFGKSGLWKSTLARLLSGFLKPLSWSICLDNKIIDSPSKNILYLSQKNDVFYRLTIYQNLYLLCHNKENVDVVLKQIWLYDYKNKFPKELSGGMIKRLSFGKALLLKTKVLILDEPFVHLDLYAKKELFILLADLHKFNSGIIIILISHSRNEMKIANNLIIFKEKINNLYREKLKQKNMI